MDLIYLGVVALMFLLTLGLLKMCEKLAETKSGEQS